ncbi:helix-turn-helix transcriptional regulator [Microbacterium sp. NPDC091662]|uniref:helix-turn-helix transcriptional regulator n=1 Tax=Microbacterium sp. NPDC091662 TaxID=3364211 RepID=UPI0037F74E0B
MVIVARALKAYRNSENLTQEEAAAIVGCSIPTYRQLELGTSEIGHFSDPKLSTLMRVLTVLHLDGPMLRALDQTVTSSSDDGTDGHTRVSDVDAR